MAKKTLFVAVAILMIGSNAIFAQNSVFENIFNRKSVRSYTEQQVSLDDLKLLVKAGMAAPSGMNRQPWEFVIIHGKEEMAALSQKLPNNRMLKEAQAAIVVAGNPQTSHYWYLDCSAATQNILLAAESMGLGAVWTAGYPGVERMKAISDAVGIPEPYLPLCLIPIGYPKGEQTPKDKWKQEKLHINKW